MNNFEKEKEYLENKRKAEELYSSGQYLKAVSYWFKALQIRFDHDIHMRIITALDRLPDKHKPPYLFSYGKQLLVLLDAKMEALEVLGRAVALDPSLKGKLEELLSQAAVSKGQRAERTDLDRELDDALDSMDGVVVSDQKAGEANSKRISDMMDELLEILKK